MTYRSLKKYKEALKYFKKAVSIAEKLGNEAALAFYEGNAAETAIFAGNTVDARRFLQSIEDKSYLANDPLYANALTVLLQSYIMLRSYNKADKAAALILRQYNSFDGMPDEQWAKSKFSSALFELPPNSV